MCEGAARLLTLMELQLTKLVAYQYYFFAILSCADARAVVDIFFGKWMTGKLDICSKMT